MHLDLLLFAFPAAMAFAAVMDGLTMTIPNKISIALVGSFVVAVAFTSLPFETIALHVASGSLMLVVGIGMFAAGWVGGGDAKLLAASALWLGMPLLAPMLVATAGIGSFLLLAIVVYRTYPAAALPIPDWALRLHRSETGLPYGIAIGSAGLILFPYSEIFRALG